MAFQLHIIDAPNVTDPKSADVFLAQERGKPPAWTSKFAAFKEAITQSYPDLSEEDEDGDNDENVWEEGLSEQTSSGSVKSLTLKEELTDEVLVVAIARAAIQAGLQCYDDEGQVLYRADGKVVNTQGRATAL